MALLFWGPILTVIAAISAIVLPWSTAISTRGLRHGRRNAITVAMLFPLLVWLYLAIVVVGLAWYEYHSKIYVDDDSSATALIIILIMTAPPVLIGRELKRRLARL